MPCRNLRFAAYPELMHGAGLGPALFDYFVDLSVFDEAKMLHIGALPVGAARKP